MLPYPEESSVFQFKSAVKFQCIDYVITRSIVLQFSVYGISFTYHIYFYCALQFELVDFSRDL